MENCLPLSGTAAYIPFFTIFLYLSYVTSDGFPSFDLPLILYRESPAHVIAAVPLEPAPRVLMIYPAFTLPVA